MNNNLTKKYLYLPMGFKYICLNKVIKYMKYVKFIKIITNKNMLTCV